MQPGDLVRLNYVLGAGYADPGMPLWSLPDYSARDSDICCRVLSTEVGIVLATTQGEALVLFPAKLGWHRFGFFDRVDV